MSDDHRRYLVVEQGVGAAVFNFVLNGAIAWGVFRRLDVVPLWGEQSIAGDTIVTGILLPLLTCVIATGIVRRHVRAGHVPPLGGAHPTVAWLPRGAFLRGLVLAAVTSVTLVPLTLGLLGALGVAGMAFWPFVAFKAAWAAGAALIVTPVVALHAIGDPPARPAIAG